MVFTCGKCDTRSVKTFSKRSYAHGLVLVRCPGCQKLHLIADHLGWFGDKGWTVEDLAKEPGTRIKVATGAGSAEALSVEDMAGWSRVEQLLATAAQGRSQDGAGGGGGGGGQDGQDEAGAGDGGVPAEDARQVWEVAPEDLERWRRVREASSSADLKKQ